MARYVRKPEVIEARQWTVKNTDEIVEWTAGRASFDPFEHNLRIEQGDGSIKRIAPGGYVVRRPNRTFVGFMKDDFEAVYAFDDSEEEETYEAIDPLDEIKAKEAAERERVRQLKLRKPDEVIVDDGKGPYKMGTGPFG